MRPKAGTRPTTKGKAHGDDRGGPEPAPGGVRDFHFVGRRLRRRSRRRAADGAARRRRPVGRTPRAPRRGDASGGRRGPQGRHRRVDRAARPRRALESVRDGRARIQRRDAHGQLVPPLLDDQAGDECGAAHVVRGRQVPVERSARQVHPGVQGRAGARRHGRRAHAPRSAAPQADDPRRVSPHGGVQLRLQSECADRSSICAERRRLRARRRR